MGALQFVRECDAKIDGYMHMATGSSAGESMASRLGVSRATTHIQPCVLYTQDLVASGVLRHRTLDTKDNLADRH